MTLEVGNTVRITRGDYTGVIAKIVELKVRDTGFWANYNVGLQLPIEIVPDGKSVPFWEHEVELVKET